MDSLARPLHRNGGVLQILKVKLATDEFSRLLSQQAEKLCTLSLYRPFCCRLRNKSCMLANSQGGAFVLLVKLFDLGRETMALFDCQCAPRHTDEQ